MDQELIDEAGKLFSIVENCAKHGSFNNLSTLCMGRLKEIEKELMEKNDADA